MATHNDFSKRKTKLRNGNYDNVDSPDSNDPIKEQSLDLDEWVKFISYYRYYIDEFACDILGLKLYPFQRLILRAMARYQNSMLICCRGLGEYI